MSTADTDRDRENAIAVCHVCGMPIRVVFEGGEIVQVLSVCGHQTEDS